MVFSDLDGTIIDYDTGSTQGAAKGLRLLKEKNVPLIFISSKTKSEMDELLYLGDDTSPYIFENGAGIVWRRGSATNVELAGRGIEPLIAMCKSVAQVISVSMETIFDISLDRLCSILGTSEEKARHSAERQASLPFLCDRTLTASDLGIINRMLLRQGMAVTRGVRFNYLCYADVNKGTAAMTVMNRYRARGNGYGISIGIGDGENDVPLFKTVDFPVLIRKKNGTIIESGISYAYISRKRESEGFSEAIEFINAMGYF